MNAIGVASMGCHIADAHQLFEVVTVVDVKNGLHILTSRSPIGKYLSLRHALRCALQMHPHTHTQTHPPTHLTTHPLSLSVSLSVSLSLSAPITCSGTTDEPTSLSGPFCHSLSVLHLDPGSAGADAGSRHSRFWIRFLHCVISCIYKSMESWRASCQTCCSIGVSACSPQRYQSCSDTN